MRGRCRYAPSQRRARTTMREIPGSAPSPGSRVRRRNGMADRIVAGLRRCDLVDELEVDEHGIYASGFSNGAAWPPGLRRPLRDVRRGHVLRQPAEVRPLPEPALALRKSSG